MGPRAGLDGCGFDARTVQPVATAIPTELSRPQYIASNVPRRQLTGATQFKTGFRPCVLTSSPPDDNLDPNSRPFAKDFSSRSDPTLTLPLQRILRTDPLPSAGLLRGVTWFDTDVSELPDLGQLGP